VLPKTALLPFLTWLGPRACCSVCLIYLPAATCSMQPAIPGTPGEIGLAAVSALSVHDHAGGLSQGVSGHWLDHHDREIVSRAASSCCGIALGGSPHYFTGSFPTGVTRHCW